MSILNRTFIKKIAHMPCLGEQKDLLHWWRRSKLKRSDKSSRVRKVRTKLWGNLKLQATIFQKMRRQTHLVLVMAVETVRSTSPSAGAGTRRGFPAVSILGFPLPLCTPGHVRALGFSRLIPPKKLLARKSDIGEHEPSRMAKTLKAQYNLWGGKKIYRKCSGNCSEKRGFCPLTHTEGGNYAEYIYSSQQVSGSVVLNWGWKIGKKIELWGQNHCLT